MRGAWESSQRQRDLIWSAARPRLLVGVVHLRPLPGAPRWAGSMSEVVRAAVADARAYARGGVHALCLENFGDLPFTGGAVGPETVAAMAVVAAAVREAVELPLGFNVLRNDARAALALCAACGGRFVRVNVHTGAMLTDQGILQGNAYETVRYRQQVAPEAAIWADVHVKHAVRLGDWPLEVAAWDTWKRGLADALIVSGVGTGQAADPEQLRRLREACPGARLLVGSGITPENLERYAAADGFLVGTSLKRGGRIEEPVDVRRVAALVRALGRLPPPAGRA
ncbi:BtpA/SgcQ family protein [Limisphaera sp. VF-2]|uniref:BtpA/SgcQ family protein n=1 Tax=Limisphaera sp. VF-2 TaxID=3400418 RepID=UPI002568BCAB|nr:BtpA/SgcQ family protein [Limisphaera sp.]